MSPKVQQQTCDIAAAIDALLAVTPGALHVAFLEDDWLLCPNGLQVTHDQRPTIGGP